jgi:phosphoribosylcarboxyaminoimidazole (NCAIR) mutase
LTVAARGGDLRQGLRAAYAGVARVGWEGAVLRRDIGLKGLLRDRGGRRGNSVAILVGAGTPVDAADKVASHLKRFDLGIVQGQGLAGRAATAWLWEQEAQGIEVIIVFDSMAAELSGQTALPVILLKGVSIPGVVASIPGVAEASTPEQAAWLAARILAVKYPDVQARLQTAQLEMTGAPGESRVAGSAATTFPPR